MATESSDKAKKGRKNSESIRERAEKATGEPKTRRIKSTAGKALTPIKAVHRVGKKEYYLPMPQNRVGKFLNKKRRVIPAYFRNAWAELRQVEWPSRRETLRLTVAVLVFALLFGLIISLTDYGLDKLFRKVLLK